MHYGLTKWLAVKAGFDPKDAETIALGTESADMAGPYPAPSAVFLHTCFGRNVAWSRLVQEYHFASYGPVPGRPKDRAVTPGRTSGASDAWARKEITAKLADLPRERALASFGASLHPLEDSWSHQGDPDIPPFPCSENLSWGHPKERDGWLSHNADLTWKHEADTLETARKVFALLKEYLAAHPEWGKPSSLNWNELEPDVREFARAGTKSVKYDWFKKFQASVPFSDYRFLNRINLYENEASMPTPVVVLPQWQITPAAQIAGPVPECAQDFATIFLVNWIVEPNLDRALEYVDIESFVSHLAARTEGKRPDYRVWARTLLGMWLLEDHGLVNELGHGLPRKGFASLSAAVNNRAAYSRYGALAEAIWAPAGAAPFLLVPAPREPQQTGPVRGERYAALFQIRHAPRDAVALLFERRGKDWRVVGMDWSAQ